MSLSSLSSHILRKMVDDFTAFIWLVVMTSKIQGGEKGVGLAFLKQREPGIFY